MRKGLAASLLALIAVVSFLLGLVVAGGTPAGSYRGVVTPAALDPRPLAISTIPAPPIAGPSLEGADFAAVAARVNGAVVNIDAVGRDDRGRTPRRFQREMSDENGAPVEGSGSGFIIDAEGFVLTNYHVVEGADRVTVTLGDGRAFLATIVGIDPAIDVALLKVQAPVKLQVAALGNSDTLKVGEWVCAIGNPLGYEHSVTVGVVSFLGRKLFDPSLDDYIQTDAAINFGNSGGPLINSRGEVIGINAAISSRASSIGFAVPINGASAILPQLKASGRVSRGYIGAFLRDVDADLSQALGLSVDRGALVQDVTEGSPADRAGLRPYDVIVSLDDRVMVSDDQVIQSITTRSPGTTSRLGILRDGRQAVVAVKLAERPRSTLAGNLDPPDAGDAAPAKPQSLLGLVVRDLDATAFNSLDLPADTRGVLVTRVEPMSASFDADLRRNTVILQINRQTVLTAADYRRVAESARPGDVLALYIYLPDVRQRKLVTLRVER